MATRDLFNGGTLKLALIGLLSALINGAQAAPQEDFLALMKPYASFGTLDTTFTQEKYIKGLTHPLTARGQLHVDRRAQIIRWQVTQPEPFTVTIANQKMTLKGMRGNESFEQSFDLNQQQDEAARWKWMSAWMEMDPQKIADLFLITKQHKAFHFEPKVKSTPFQSIQAQVASRGWLEQLTLFEPSGDRLELHFTQPVIKK